MHTFPDTRGEHHDSVAHSGDKVQEAGDGLGDEARPRPVGGRGVVQPRLLDDPEGAGVGRGGGQRRRD